jgi:hypothetical protein
VFGRLDDLRARGAERVQQLQQNGYNDAQLYDPTESSVREIHAAQVAARTRPRSFHRNCRLFEAHNRGESEALPELNRIVGD